MGNFDIPIDAEAVEQHKEDLIAISQWKHPEVFGVHKKPDESAFQVIERMIQATICKIELKL